MVTGKSSIGTDDVVVGLIGMLFLSDLPLLLDPHALACSASSLRTGAEHPVGGVCAEFDAGDPFTWMAP